MEEPSQAEKLEAGADAGPGTTDKPDAGDPLSEKPANGPPPDGPANGTSTGPSKNATDLGLKPGQTAVQKERSAFQVALIMFSLCVWIQVPKSIWESMLLIVIPDGCLPRGARYCKH